MLPFWLLWQLKGAIMNKYVFCSCQDPTENWNSKFSSWFSLIATNPLPPSADSLHHFTMAVIVNGPAVTVKLFSRMRLQQTCTRTRGLAVLWDPMSPTQICKWTPFNFSTNFQDWLYDWWIFMPAHVYWPARWPRVWSDYVTDMNLSPLIFSKLLSCLGSFICIAPFYNKIVSRCFKEWETQSQNPPVSTVPRKNSLLTGRNLEQDPAYREEPSCWESAG